MLLLFCVFCLFCVFVVVVCFVWGFFVVLFRFLFVCLYSFHMVRSDNFPAVVKIFTLQLLTFLTNLLRPFCNNIIV